MSCIGMNLSYYHSALLTSRFDEDVPPINLRFRFGLEIDSDQIHVGPISSGSDLWTTAGCCYDNSMKRGGGMSLKCLSNMAVDNHWGWGSFLSQ